jgi:hypothetical protein
VSDQRRQEISPTDAIHDLKVAGVIDCVQEAKMLAKLDAFPHATVLSRAAALVAGDRNADYGHPQEDFARTAALWSAIFGFDVTPMHVALCMIAVKLSRQCHKHKADNLVDIAGYAQTAAWLDSAAPLTKHDKEN